MTSEDKPLATETASCVCLRVRYDPERHANGSFFERWCCDSCGTEFSRLAQFVYEREKLAEVAAIYKERILVLETELARARELAQEMVRQCEQADATCAATRARLIEVVKERDEAREQLGKATDRAIVSDGELTWAQEGLANARAACAKAHHYITEAWAREERLPGGDTRIVAALESVINGGKAP